MARPLKNQFFGAHRFPRHGRTLQAPLPSGKQNRRADPALPVGGAGACLLRRHAEKPSTAYAGQPTACPSPPKARGTPFGMRQLAAAFSSYPPKIPANPFAPVNPPSIILHLSFPQSPLTKIRTYDSIYQHERRKCSRVRARQAPSAADSVHHVHNVHQVHSNRPAEKHSLPNEPSFSRANLENSPFLRLFAANQLKCLSMNILHLKIESQTHQA